MDADQKSPVLQLSTKYRFCMIRSWSFNNSPIKSQEDPSFFWRSRTGPLKTKKIVAHICPLVCSCLSPSCSRTFAEAKRHAKFEIRLSLGMNILAFSLFSVGLFSSAERLLTLYGRITETSTTDCAKTVLHRKLVQWYFWSASMDEFDQIKKLKIEHGTFSHKEYAGSFMFHIFNIAVSFLIF